MERMFLKKAASSASSDSMASASMARAIGAVPKEEGEQSRILSIVRWKRAGVGLPSSIQKVAPFQIAPLKFTFEPEMWFQGSQSRTLGIRSGSYSGSRASSRRPSWPPIMEHMAPCVVGTGFGRPVEPEVKRYLAIEASSSLAMALATASVGSVATRSS